MNAEILQIAAAAIGSIVILVVFFRVLGWVDLWMRKRITTGESRKRKKVRRQRDAWDTDYEPESTAESFRPSRMRRTLAAKGFADVPILREIEQDHEVEGTVTRPSHFEETALVQLADEHSVLSFDETRAQVANAKVELMVHLNNGEVIGPVRADLGNRQTTVSELGMDASDFLCVLDRENRAYMIRRSMVNMVVRNELEDRVKNVAVK